MNCAKCGRALKNPSPSGYGPVCLRAVTGSKPGKVRADRRTKRSADERQVEIAFEVRP